MEFLLMAAKQRGIPEEFAKEFHEAMGVQGWVVKDTTKEGVISPSRVTRGNVAMIMGQWWRYRKKHPERQGGYKTPSFQKHAWNHLEPKQDELENAKRIFGE